MLFTLIKLLSKITYQPGKKKVFCCILYLHKTLLVRTSSSSSFGKIWRRRHFTKLILCNIPYTEWIHFLTDWLHLRLFNSQNLCLHEKSKHSRFLARDADQIVMNKFEVCIQEKLIREIIRCIIWIALLKTLSMTSSIRIWWLCCCDTVQKKERKEKNTYRYTLGG